LAEKAKEMGLRLDFSMGYDDFSVTPQGPIIWDIDGGVWVTISPEKYLDALRQHLIARLREAEQAESDLRYLIMRFSRKQARFKELKREGREPK